MSDTPDTAPPDADFLTVLSSELIAEVMEDYFNKKLYKQKVKVVDLQPQGSGYAFSLAFVEDTAVIQTAPLPKDTCVHGVGLDIYCWECDPDKQSVVIAALHNGLTKAMRAETDAYLDRAMTKRDAKGKFVSIKQKES